LRRSCHYSSLPWLDEEITFSYSPTVKENPAFKNAGFVSDLKPQPVSKVGALLLILIWLTVVNRRHSSRPLCFCGLVLI
jgi:hypothetical protein